ncbi:uncharacterized protein TRIREDRAFT_104251 [Trichoderma reesei QM6a]|uniref:Predicted protein n=1 Tax=Hypocrea jecorina (strain QM6a) TaxID=431241 RepID=G0RBW0_HYPJQ|nr:uncharacterized protein TRIREDRAFT_104251 [Trichoderma reesei QM6a]EGR51394.1 predicted protein [Trichoderma reesei QM6a]
MNVVPFFNTWYGNAVLFVIILHLGMLRFERATRVEDHSTAATENLQHHRSDSPHGCKRCLGDIAFSRIDNALDSTERHPLFQPAFMRTYVQLTELYVDMRDSRSTFFSDIDACRAKLMRQIVEPAWPMDDIEIEFTDQNGKDRREKVVGRPAVILGATHTSFRHELRSHTTYTIKTRILGWDSSWVFVGSWIISNNEPRGNIYATNLAKYIIKKGSITVRPEQYFEECGWISSRQKQDHKEEHLTSNARVWSWLETERVKNKDYED